jgi:hypothetical protein
VISGVSKGDNLYILKATTKTFSGLSVKSNVGLTSVTFQCAAAAIKAVPAFDATTAKNLYAFDMQIGEVSAAGMCMISATDSAKQTTEVVFVVQPQ